MLAAVNLPWWRHDRPWGFRFSLMDAIIVVGGALLTEFDQEIAIDE